MSDIDHWIKILDTAIQKGIDFEAEDGETNQVFNFDLEALQGILDCFEAGATTDEVETQFDEFVKGSLSQYMALLEALLDEPDEGSEDLADEPLVESDVLDIPTVSAGVVGDQDEVSGDSMQTREADDTKPAKPPKPGGKSKKGVVLAAVFGGLFTVIGVGGFVGYKLLDQQTSGPTRSVENIPTLKSTPKPPIEDQAIANQPAPQSAVSEIRSSQPVSSPEDQALRAQQQSYSVSQMPSQPQSQAQSIQQTTSSQPSQFQPGGQEMALQSTSSAPDPEAISKEVERQFSDFKSSVTTQIGNRFGSLEDQLAALKTRLQKIDALEKELAARESSEDSEKKDIESRLRGLTRLGEFSVLTASGVDGRVVALSPTNRVITLEEGEENIIAAGTSLTVQEVIGDGEAVIFSDGWFIDKVRASETLREQRASKNASSKSNDPEVPNTAKVAEVPSPASVAAANNMPVQRSSNTDSRFPAIERAPSGWEASALIPPRRAVIITPGGESLTVTMGATISGLGKIHAVRHDRVLAGQFYIPLSNM